MVFAASPVFRVADPSEDMAAAMETPFSKPELGGMFKRDTLSEATAQGAVDSFGLGTVIKDITVPRGNTQQEPSLVDRALNLVPVVNAGRAAYELGLEALNANRPQQPSMSAAEYKASPYFRTSIPYDPGMTEDRAAALASYADTKAVREHFGQLRPVASFLGNFVGQALDPINYVPIFGPAAKTALAARFGESFLGTVASHALLGASEAAINTAAFATLTAGLRRQYGDDVSWQATLNEVGMSALIGTAFGAVGGTLGAGMKRMAGHEAARASLEATRLSDQLSTAKTAQEARIPLNEAVGSLATDGTVKLSPNGIAAVQRLADDVTLRTAGRRALSTETAHVTGNEAGKVVVTPTGERVAVQPEIIDASQLQKATGDLQVRNRTNNPNSDAQIEDIASKLDPALLLPSIHSDSGAPVVGPDNIVDSGNGRVAAIVRAAEAYPERYAAYKQALRDAGYTVPDEGVPVLVIRRTTDLSPEARAQFNADANLPSTARMSASELAAMDRAALDNNVLGALSDGPVTAAGNRPFVARFLANLSQNERNGLVDVAGNLNADGARRIENALVAAAYGDVDAGVVRRFAEATDDNTRAIVGAMSDAAGPWALMRRAMQSGELAPEFDMTAELTQSLRLLSGFREQAAREGRPVSVVIQEGLRQLDLLSGEVAPETQLLIRSFYQNDHFARAAGRDSIAANLRAIAAATSDLGKPQLFADALPTSKMEVLHGALETPGQGSLFAPDGAEPGLSSDGQGLAADGGAGQASGQAADGQPGSGAGAAGGSDAGGGASAAATGAEQPVAGGAAGSAGIAPEIGKPLALKSLPDAQQKPAATAFIDSQPDRSIADLYAAAPAHQAELASVAKALGEEHGAPFKDPGLKKEAATAEKMGRKGYVSTRQLTDVVRGGFVVDHPAQAEAIVAGLGQRFKLLDEGWRMTEANYFDRKVLVQFGDGTIGEVQFWHPELLDLKKAEGHKLYTEMRSLPDGDPRKLELLAQQQLLYGKAMRTEKGGAWEGVVAQLADEGRTAVGKNALNLASEIGTPESITSAKAAGDQSAPGLAMNQALDPSVNAGRFSQSNSLRSAMPEDIGRATPEVNRPLFRDGTVDAAGAKPDAAPEGLQQAAARVGKPEDLRTLAADRGVDMVSGDYLEAPDIAQMREEGRLTAADEAALTLADADYAKAEAYGNALKAAINCML